MEIERVLVTDMEFRSMYEKKGTESEKLVAVFEFVYYLELCGGGSIW